MVFCIGVNWCGEVWVVYVDVSVNYGVFGGWVCVFVFFFDWRGRNWVDVLLGFIFV